MEQNQQKKVSSGETKGITKRKDKNLSTKKQHTGDIKIGDDSSDDENEELWVRILYKLLLLFHSMVKYSLTLNL